jgi:hypothetical protein
MADQVIAVDAEFFEEGRILLHQPVQVVGHGSILQDL